MKVAILAEGQFARATAKTAIGVLRYAPFEVVAVVDSTRAGKDAVEYVGVGAGVPVVASVEDAFARGATVLLIGTAAAGGRIPDGYRPALARALERGIEVWNGLHELVLADPVLAAAAERGGAKVRELREPPRDLPIGGHRARREGVRVVLTVGSDAAVGKMTVALEIVAALRRARERVRGSRVAGDAGRVVIPRRIGPVQPPVESAVQVLGCGLRAPCRCGRMRRLRLRGADRGERRGQRDHRCQVRFHDRPSLRKIARLKYFRPTCRA